MGAYLGAMWGCRFFWLSLVKMDLRSRYRGSILGIGWSLLNPIAMTTILCAVFYVWMHKDLRFYAPFVFIGMTFWGFFSAVTSQGCGCFFQGESYIRQFPAPMAIYPLRTVLGSGFHFGVGLFLAIILALSAGPDLDAAPGSSRLMQLLTLPTLVPTLLLVLLFGWSIAVLFGLLNVRFRDTRHLAEVGLQGLFYLTPIMLDFEREMQGRRLLIVFQCNPLAPFLRLLRDPILYGHAPSLATYALATAITLVLTGAAMLALKAEERRLIFYL
jgi:ABC-type polysaccharide/polyol phosphate export permease